MVSKKKAEIVRPKAPVGPQCTVVAGCAGVAVLQATRNCDSCGGETQTLTGSADRRRRELAEYAYREDAIKQAARRREGRCGCGDESSHDGSQPDSDGKPLPCPRALSGDLTELEALELRIIAGGQQEAGANLEELEAAIGRVAKEHTHPVFGCEKHKSRLPK